MLGRTTPVLGNELKLLEVDAESCAWEPAMFQTAEICMQGFKGGEQAKGVKHALVSCKGAGPCRYTIRNKFSVGSRL